MLPARLKLVRLLTKRKPTACASDADESGGRETMQPTVFYRWQKEFSENGAAAFEQKARPNHSADHERIA
jgi:hypothetical protein